MKRSMSTVGLMLTLVACQGTAGGSKATPVRALAARCDAAPSGDSSAAIDTRRDQLKLKAADADANAWLAVGQDFVRMARTHAEPRYYLQAEACAREALARSPEEAGAQRLMGLVLLNQHRFADARALGLELLARHPEDAVSWGTLSDAELELGNIPAAIAAAQQMMDRKPNLPSYGRAAHLRWLQGDTQGAKFVYQQAIAAGREHKDHEPRAWMLVQAAWLFWHEGDYAGAAAGFDLALREVADYPAALEGKGRAALAQGEYRAAIGWLSRALAAHPLVETAWALGDAYSLAGDEPAARVAYARVARDGARLDPRTLSLFYSSKAREPEQALRLAQSAYAERQDGYSKDALAFALYRAGQLSEATRLAREVIALGTPDARLLYHAGLIERAAGDAASGEALMARALHLNPRFDLLLTGAAHATITARL
jgi:tetratricopeptide (TPR) repeat protein